MILIEGKRVKIGEFNIQDVYFMRNWGKHDNPLFEDYNFPQMDDDEIVEWYESKTLGMNKKYFSVYNEHDRFIGYLGIKHIRRMLKESTLGIVFDPNFLNEGYGTEAIKTFLKYYFSDLGMKTLILEVAKFNKRALRCYEKCGFVIVDEYIRRFFDESLDINSPYFQNEIDSFVIKFGRIYNYIYKMKIDKERFEKISDKIEL